MRAMSRSIMSVSVEIFLFSPFELTMSVKSIISLTYSAIFFFFSTPNDDQ
jgi:hypothetical protein